MLRTFLLFFFIAQALGLIGTLIHTRRLDAERRARTHKKFFIYFVVTLLVPLASMERLVFVLLCSMIVAVGLYELYSLRIAGRACRWWAGLTYAAIAVGFVWFAFKVRPEVIILVYCAIAALDGFSQIFGQLLGRTKLAPRISPSKTLEGSVGGVAAGLFFFAALNGFAVSLQMLGWMALVLICGIVGDLLASAYKRAAQVKDFSRLIPHHGGVLDRFDSFMLAAAVYAVLPLSA